MKLNSGLSSVHLSEWSGFLQLIMRWLIAYDCPWIYLRIWLIILWLLLGCPSNQVTKSWANWTVLVDISWIELAPRPDNWLSFIFLDNTNYLFILYFLMFLILQCSLCFSLLVSQLCLTSPIFCLARSLPCPICCLSVAGTSPSPLLPLPLLPSFLLSSPRPLLFLFAVCWLVCQFITYWYTGVCGTCTCLARDGYWGLDWDFNPFFQYWCNLYSNSFVSYLLNF